MGTTTRCLQWLDGIGLAGTKAPACRLRVRAFPDRQKYGPGVRKTAVTRAPEGDAPSHSSYANCVHLFAPEGATEDWCAFRRSVPLIAMRGNETKLGAKSARENDHSRRPGCGAPLIRDREPHTIPGLQRITIALEDARGRAYGAALRPG